MCNPQVAVEVPPGALGHLGPGVEPLPVLVPGDGQRQVPLRDHAGEGESVAL